MRVTFLAIVLLLSLAAVQCSQAAPPSPNSTAVSNPTEKEFDRYWEEQLREFIHTRAKHAGRADEKSVNGIPLELIHEMLKDGVRKGYITLSGFIAEHHLPTSAHSAQTRIAQLKTQLSRDTSAAFLSLKMRVAASLQAKCMPGGIGQNPDQCCGILNDWFAKCAIPWGDPPGKPIDPNAGKLKDYKVVWGPGCPRFDGVECNGFERGECKAKKCECKEDWSGIACQTAPPLKFYDPLSAAAEPTLVCRDKVRNYQKAC